MKLSNKILIGFFGFIFIYLTAAFTEIRFRGNLNHLDESSGIAETIDLSGVKYLVLQDLNKSINVVGSENSRLEVQSISGDLLKNLTYEVKGDTLELKQLLLEDNERINLTVFVSNDLFEGMAVHDAQVSVSKLDQNHLRITQMAGRINFSDDNQLNNLDVVSSDGADLYFAGSKLDTLSVQLNNANISVEAGSMRVEGRLSNDAYLYMSDVDDISVKKDRSSRLYFN